MNLLNHKMISQLFVIIIIPAHVWFVVQDVKL